MDAIPQGGEKKEQTTGKPKKRKGVWGKRGTWAQQWVTSFSTDHEHGKKTIK